MSAAARSAVLTVQAVLLVLAARWLGVHRGHADMRGPIKTLLVVALVLFVAAVVIALRGDVQQRTEVDRG